MSPAGTPLIIGKRLRRLREQRKLSQGDIEKRTGLLRSYISRIENGHSIPTIETLERMAIALGVPLYQLFYDGQELRQLPAPSEREGMEEITHGIATKEALFLRKFCDLIARIDAADQELLLSLAQRMAAR